MFWLTHVFALKYRKQRNRISTQNEYDYGKGIKN